MTIKKRIATLILCLALVLAVGGEALLSAFAIKARAEGTYYTDVLVDLKQDKNFNPADYSSDSKDYSLNLIQIAESTANELFLYVYQPSAETKPLTATAVSISLTVGVDYSPERYSLTLLDTNGVFSKYKVEDFTIPEGSKHTFVVTSLYRPYDSSIDGEHTTDNTLSEIACGVGQTWTVSYVNDRSYVDMEYEDYIQVVSKHVGFARYEDSDGFWLTRMTDSHYIAFSTDKKIDQLLEVDVEFNYKSIQEHYQKNSLLGTEKRWTDIVSEGSESVTITSDQIFEKNNTLWFPDYEYMRIQTVDALIKNEGEHMDDTTKGYLKEKEWIVRFYESPYAVVDSSNSSVGLTQYRWDSTEVTDVVMLRMKYQFNGKTYNLGVVDNVQSGDLSPDWVVEVEEQEWWQKLMLVLGIILIIVLLLAFGGPISFVLKVIWDGLKFILSIFLWLLSIPFKFIGWLFKPK